MEVNMKYQEALQAFLADLAVVNVKLHNLHWNVKGKMFFQLHDRTEDLYDYMFEQFDEVAELMKIKEVYPLASLKDYVAHATIKELDSKDYNADEVIKIVVDDLKSLIASGTAIRHAADEEDDFTTVMLFEDIVAELDKNLWFFRSL